jgi:opacity protein-like surface antigen
MKPSYRSCVLAGFWFAAASSVAVQAGAQSEAEFDRNGPYLMAGGGYSFENFKDTDPLHFDDSPHVLFNAGWRFHPNAAVDVGFEWNTGFDANFEGFDAELETYFATVGMKIYALKGRIQPFLHPSVGVMVAKADVDAPADPDAPEISSGVNNSKTTPALRGGAGVDIYATENLFVSFSVSYVLPLDKEVSDAQYTPISAAIGWRF